jgi:hypothetical protein
MDEVESRRKSSTFPRLCLVLLAVGRMEMVDCIVLGKVFWFVEFELLEGIVFDVFDNSFVSKPVLNASKDLCHFLGNVRSGNCCFGRNLQFNVY